MENPPDLLTTLCQPAHESKAVQSPNPRGNERRAHAQVPELPVNTHSPIGAHQRLPSISNVVSENVQMQAALGQKRQSAHETKHHGPPAVQPWPFRKLPESDVGRDALAELTEVAEKGKLDVLHVLQLRDQSQRAGQCPDLAPIPTASKGASSWGKICQTSNVFDCPHFAQIRRQSRSLFQDADGAMLFMWHRNRKAICHCLAAILTLADDSSMDVSS